MTGLKSPQPAVVTAGLLLLAVLFSVPLTVLCNPQVQGPAASKPGNPHADQPRALQPTSTKVLSVPHFSSTGLPLSDDSGNLYFRPSVANDQLAIFKLSPQNESNSKIIPVSSEGLDGYYFVDYSVTRSGSLYILAEDVKHQFHILSFDSDGQVKRKEKLQTPDYLLVIDFAAFENGTILATGYYERDAPAPLHGKSYAALFDQSGQLLKGMSSKFSLEDASSEPNGPLAHISMRPGGDGNLYLLGPSSVLVVSPGGEVVRRLKLVNPEPESVVRRLKLVNPEPESVAIDLEVSDGLILIELGDKPGPRKRVNPRYLVIDAVTGKRYGYYRAPDEINGMLGHFSRDEGLTFITSDRGNIKLVTAAMN
jgi:hypothetical protein